MWEVEVASITTVALEHPVGYYPTNGETLALLLASGIDGLKIVYEANKNRTNLNPLFDGHTDDRDL
ncbi:unnamed protein product [Clonostachys rosea]|uniref:Uncharacterized protein n=1 Tax=Bionectria ochroleuca TaxID=29856 RepID=A0ABY6UCV1_BIOOC|nr:unnamed protein product [Clonostachys rosea]